MQCLTSHDVQRLLDEQLSPEKQAQARAHLQNCCECQAALEAELTQRHFDAELNDARTLLLGNDSTNSFESGEFLPVRQQLVGGIHESAAPTLPVPTELEVAGPYRLIKPLGMGSMGTVFLAKDPELERTVAIKVLRPDRNDSQSRLRLVREAKAAAGLQDDHIVTVHAVANPADAAPYIVMQYVEGPSLRELIAANRQLGVRQAAIIAAGIAHGLAKAHAAGLVHRDIKPGNVIVDQTDHRPKILDFGLVRECQADGMTQDGMCLGTPEYMSPEQFAKPSAVDARTDIYSLGVTLYEMLTGTVPFHGTPHQIMQQTMHDVPPSPRRLNAQIPPDLETICLKAMEQEPVRRYQTAASLAADLERWLRGEPILAHPVGLLGRVLRWQRRKPALAALTFTCALSVAIGFAAVLSQWHRAEAHLEEFRRQQRETQLYQAQAIEEQQQRERTEAEAQVVKTRADQAQGQLLSVVLQSQLRQDTNPARFNEMFLEQIQGISLAAAEHFGDSEVGQLKVAGTYLCQGNLYRQLEQNQKALESYQTALAMFRQMLDQPPADDAEVPKFNRIETRQAMATTLHWLGVMQAEAGEHQAAQTCFAEALVILTQLVQDKPEAHNFPLERIRTRIALGLSQQQAGSDSRPTLQQARADLLALQQQATSGFDMLTRKSIIGSYRELGDALAATGERDESLALYRVACHLGRRMVGDLPKYPHSRSELAASLNHLGEFLLDSGDAAEAVEVLQEAVAQQAAVPGMGSFLEPAPKIQRDKYLANFALALRQNGAYQRCIEISQERQAAADWDPEICYAAAGNMALCIAALEKSDSPADLEPSRELAFAALRKAIDLGFCDKERLQNDEALAALREHAQFALLLELSPRTPPPTPIVQAEPQPQVARNVQVKAPTKSQTRQGPKVLAVPGRQMVRVRTLQANPQAVRRMKAGPQVQVRGVQKGQLAQPNDKKSGS